jgi:hypothetical protein
MKKVLLYCLSYFLYEGVSSQNLLMNGGFEEENICTEYIKNVRPKRGWPHRSMPIIILTPHSNGR